MSEQDDTRPLTAFSLPKSIEQKTLDCLLSIDGRLAELNRAVLWDGVLVRPVDETPPQGAKPVQSKQAGKR